MTSIETMENDVALMLLSIDVSRQRKEPHRFMAWPEPGDMMGADAVNPDVAKEWSETIKTIYRAKAKPLVFMLNVAGYRKVEDS